MNTSCRLIVTAAIAVQVLPALSHGFVVTQEFGRLETSASGSYAGTPHQDSATATLGVLGLTGSSSSEASGARPATNSIPSASTNALASANLSTGFVSSGGSFVLYGRGDANTFSQVSTAPATNGLNYHGSANSRAEIDSGFTLLLQGQSLNYSLDLVIAGTRQTSFVFESANIRGDGAPDRHRLSGVFAANKTAVSFTAGALSTSLANPPGWNVSDLVVTGESYFDYQLRLDVVDANGNVGVGASELNPILTSVTPSGENISGFVAQGITYVFNDVLSQSWTDPTPTDRFYYQALGSTLFTSLTMPTHGGFSGLRLTSADGFTVFDDSLDAGDVVFFENPLSSFLISGFNPLIDADVSGGFPIKLGFDDSIGSFAMSTSAFETFVPSGSAAVPEPSTYALFGATALCGIVAWKRRRQSCRRA